MRDPDALRHSIFRPGKLKRIARDQLLIARNICASSSSYLNFRSLFFLYTPLRQFASFPYAQPPICIETPTLLAGVSMLDLLMLAIGFGLFILTVGYAVACDRL